MCVCVCVCACVCTRVCVWLVSREVSSNGLGLLYTVFTV